MRRYPWVTIAVIAICIVAFFGTGRHQLAPCADRTLYRNVPLALEWHVAHPYLELDPEFERIFLTESDRDELELMSAALAQERERVLQVPLTGATGSPLANFQFLRFRVLSPIS